MKTETMKTDLEAVRELALYTENNGELYDRQAWPIIKNLARRVVAGTYDHGRAAVAWGYLADSGAREYTREFDTADGRGGYGCFDVATRRETGRELADRYAESVAFHAGELIGPARVAVEVGDYGRDVNGNRTGRIWVDGIPAGSRRVQTGSGPDMGNAWHTALTRAGYLPRWYSVARVDGNPGGFSSPSDPFHITLERAAIVVGPWTSPAGDPAYG